MTPSADEVISAAAAEQARQAIEENIAVTEHMLEQLIEPLVEAAGYATTSLVAGGKLLLFGNGGSAADSQHIAAELVGRFQLDRAAIPAMALTTDTSVLTSLANDLGIESVFARQVEAFGKKGDVAIALSTSGDSQNVLNAVEAARGIGLRTIGFTGAGGGLLAPACDLALRVPSTSTARIQEAHITIAHVICELVEAALAQD